VTAPLASGLVLHGDHPLKVDEPIEGADVNSSLALSAPALFGPPYGFPASLLSAELCGAVVMMLYAVLTYISSISNILQFYSLSAADY
jgi:hypothetical protein